MISVMPRYFPDYFFTFFYFGSNQTPQHYIQTPKTVRIFFPFLNEIRNSILLQILFFLDFFFGSRQNPAVVDVLCKLLTQSLSSFLSLISYVTPWFLLSFRFSFQWNENPTVVYMSLIDDWYSSHSLISFVMVYLPDFFLVLIFWGQSCRGECYIYTFILLK